MNLLELRTRVKGQLAGNVYFTDAEINALINQGLDQMPMMAKYTNDKISFNTVAGQLEYNLPENIIEVKNVVYNTIKLSRTNFEDALAMRSQYNILPSPLPAPPAINQPDLYSSMRYYVRSTTVAETGASVPGTDPSTTANSIFILGFIFAPSTVQNLDIYYVKNTSMLSVDGDVPAVPTQYHELLINYALSWLKRKDHEYVEGREEGNIFKEGMAEMKINLQGEEPKRVHYVPEYD